MNNGISKNALRDAYVSFERFKHCEKRNLHIVKKDKEDEVMAVAIVVMSVVLVMAIFYAAWLGVF